MKVFISSDIEGVTGVTDWKETDLENPEWQMAREQMTAEVAAACEGALQAGATEIWVKDSHDSARNLIASRLPEQVRLIRGWSGHPFQTLQELDDSFQGVILIGYHAGAGTNQNPLEHTFSGSLMCIKLNGEFTSEGSFDAYSAAYLGVPLVFVSGDQGICDQIKGLNPNINTVAVKQGVGGSTVNIHPNMAVRLIREGVAQALRGDLEQCKIALPPNFRLEMRYRDHAQAYKYSFFPGAKRKDHFTVQFDNQDYFEVMRFLYFTI